MQLSRVEPMCSRVRAQSEPRRRDPCSASSATRCFSVSVAAITHLRLACKAQSVAGQASGGKNVDLCALTPVGGGVVEICGLLRSLLQSNESAGA